MARKSLEVIADCPSRPADRSRDGGDHLPAVGDGGARGAGPGHGGALPPHRHPRGGHRPRALLLPSAEIDTIRLAALFCNLGLVRVPGTVLHKAEELSEPERQPIRQHPRLSAEMLATVPQLRPALPLVLYHHEFWNGEGYYALRGEQIPVGARIIHVAEAYEALTPRPPLPPRLHRRGGGGCVKGIGELFESRLVRVPAPAAPRRRHRRDVGPLDGGPARRPLPAGDGGRGGARHAPKREPVETKEKHVAALLRRPSARRSSAQLSS